MLDHELICAQEYEDLRREHDSGPRMLGTVMIAALCVLCLLAVIAA